MVAAVSGAASTADSQIPRRPPLLPSERDNSNGVSSNQRKPKSRIVSSRYMSPSTSTSTSNSSSVSSSSASSRRCPSPLLSRNSIAASNSPSVSPKRSVSADRRRPMVARPLIPDLDTRSGNATDISAATRLLVTSTRSFSVSFQGEAFSLPVSKTKVTPPSPNLNTARKGTPERRRASSPFRGKGEGGGDQVDHSKRVDQHRWPARNRLVNSLSRSLDCRDDAVGRKELIGSGHMIRALRQSMDQERRPAVEGRLSVDSELPAAVQLVSDGVSVSNDLSLPFELTASDSDSVSSGSTSGVQELSSSHRRNGNGLGGSARFWQETNSRLRRLHDPGSPLSTSPGSKLIVQAKSKLYASDGPLSSPRTMSSPIRGATRTASPGKLAAPVGLSPLRSHSPSRIRNVVSTISNNFCESPSVLSFAVDVRRGKVGENRIVDAHLLRLLYNRHFQWRMANARIEAVLMVQKRNAEKNLWNAWITISDLRDAVTKKRHRLQLLRQKLKLASILKGQMIFLEDLASLDKDHSTALLGAIQALKASTLRLPVGGAIADVRSLKDAIGSAVDVMKAMASSTSSLLPSVEGVDGFMTELAKVSARERDLLEQCFDYHLSSLAATQVKDGSLKTHLLQQHKRTFNSKH